MTQTNFARRVLARGESTIRDWLKGREPIPQTMSAWLEMWTTELSDGTRRRITGAYAPKPSLENTLMTQEQARAALAQEVKDGDCPANPSGRGHLNVSSSHSDSFKWERGRKLRVRRTRTSCADCGKVLGTT